MCTEECGSLQPPDDQQLLEAFAIVAHDAFAFLTPDHGLECRPLSTFNLDDGEQVAVSSSHARYPFLAVLEFGGLHHPVRLSYGEKDYRLEVEVADADNEYHDLHSWLDALGIEHTVGDDAWVSSPSSLARHALKLAHGLRDHYEEIRSAGDDARARLEKVR